MGPIFDKLGLEQGGPNASDFYNKFGKEQLEAAQLSELGVNIGEETVSAIGQPDDTILVANNIHWH